MEPTPINNSQLSDRELATTVRGLKFLINSIKELDTESTSTRAAVDSVVDILEKTTASERKSALERHINNQKKLEQERQLAEQMVNSGYSTATVNRLLKDYNSSSKESAKNFKEFTERLKDANWNAKEMGKLTKDFFKLTKAGMAAMTLDAAAFIFKADIYGKKAALIAGEPNLNYSKALGFKYSPESNTQFDIARYFSSKAVMGKSVDESMGDLRSWNFAINNGKEKEENAKYLMDASNLSTAMVKLQQVTEGTANKLIETLTMKLGYTIPEVDGAFKKLIETNKGTGMTNEKYISAIDEVINSQTRYSKNINYAVPIVKNFVDVVKEGKFTFGEVSKMFLNMAEMPMEQQAGAAMLLKQSGMPLPEAFKRAGNDPFALSVAMQSQGNSPLVMEAVYNQALQMTKNQGYTPNYGKGTDINDRGAFLGRMKKNLENFGQSGTFSQIDEIIQKLTNSNFNKVPLKGLLGDTIKKGLAVGAETQDFREMFNTVQANAVALSIESTTDLRKNFGKDYNISNPIDQAKIINEGITKLSEVLSKKIIAPFSDFEKWVNTNLIGHSKGINKDALDKD